MDELVIYFQKMSRTSNIRTLLVSGMLASLILMFHTFTLSQRKSLPSVLPASELFGAEPADSSSSYFATVSRLSLLIDSANASIADESVVSDTRFVQDDANVRDEVYDHNQKMDGDDNDDDHDDEFSFTDQNNGVLKEFKDQKGNINFSEFSLLSEVSSSLNASLDMSQHMSGSVSVVNLTDPSFMKLPITDVHSKSVTSKMFENASTVEVNNVTFLQRLPAMKRRAVPSTSIQEMTNILIRNYAAYHTMRPRWNSPRDRELLAIKAQIENAPSVRHDELLHPPLFRNISRFKRSYQLMERTLKIYVYSDGKKPVFHQPIMKGIYASEGWFMKLMEGNRHYIVRDPRRAHLFYMPFSSRYLQFAAYIRGSHNRTTLRVFLQKYVDSIASKYSFWNRTNGSDHFLVACHDWAPYATRHVMAKSFKALCNADLANGFKLGKDVSLPETYVRSARDPQRDLGGQGVDQRQTLAFYAGNLHGYLRPILLHHWENKDPDMKIMGPMPPGVESKMTYIEHMKNSKFCICPRGYEVNSPRIVESIFYECVPVIISDNYVPPFFEVLDWSTFSVFVPEKEIPNLKEILTAISEEKYQSLQLGVRRVQQHFLWHSSPVKYDLFHMILHSIWYNRVMNIRPK